MSILSSSMGRMRSSLSILLMIVLVGLFSRSNMILETQPKVSAPFILVQVYLNGISPKDGDRLLVRPIEKEIRSIEGVEEIIANAYESTAVIVVEFDAEWDIDKALTDVREAVDRAKPELPDDADEPTVNEISADEFPSLVVSLSGDDVHERELLKSAQLLKRQIENLPSILSVDLVGNREEVVEAIIDPARLQHFQITSNDLSQAIFNNNLLVAAGEMDTGEGKFSIRVPGLIETYQDVLALPLKQNSAGVIRLGDVADIRRTFQDANRYTTINGEQAMTIEINKRAKAGAIEVTDAIKEIVDNNRSRIPSAVKIGYALDQSFYTREMVGEMQGNIVTAMALVMIVVIGALGVRSGLLVGLGIPFSLLSSIIIINSMGLTFNFMVMFGMLLALGMLIDGAIVVTEFADRKMADGLNSQEAYLVATKRMFWPVVASTATTLAAFLPIMFWPGIAGQFMRYLPITVFAVLFCSIFYALFFAPLLGSLFKPSKIDPEVQQYLHHLESDSPTTLKGFTGAYARVLNRLVQIPGTVAICSIACLIGIFMLYGEKNAGMEFFTETEEKYGSITVRAQGNFSVDEMRRLSQEVEKRALSIPGVIQLYASTGKGPGAASGPRSGAADVIATMLVELDSPAKLGRPSRQVFEEIREKSADLPGIIVNAGTFEAGPPVGEPIQVQLESPFADRLEAAGSKLKKALETEFDGLRDITDTQPLPGLEWVLTVDRALAAQMGANVLEVGRAVQLVTNGVKIGEYRPDDADDEVEIRVRYPVDERGINVLDDLRINTNQGAVPISTFVKREPQRKIDKVRRVNGALALTVKSDVAPGVLADDKVKEITQWLKDNPLDPAVSYSFRGANEEQAGSLQFLGIAFSLALFLMFIMLVTQFNSFYQGVLILSAVVMSTAGVLLGLVITQSTFSTILTGVGIVALAGIVVNNNIVLIDTFNYIRKRQPDLTVEEVVIQACGQRLRPVFLTTVTTILGLLPIANNVSVDLINRSITFGGVIGSTWVPLASAIVSGLAFSTILTLIVTPVMLVLPIRIKSSFIGLMNKLKSGRHATQD